MHAKHLAGVIGGIPTPENDDPMPGENDYIWHKNVGALLVVYRDRPQELCVMTGYDGWEYLDLDDVDAMYEALGKIRQWLHATKGE